MYWGPNLEYTVQESTTRFCKYGGLTPRLTCGHWTKPSMVLEIPRIARQPYMFLKISGLLGWAAATVTSTSWPTLSMDTPGQFQRNYQRSIQTQSTSYSLHPMDGTFSQVRSIQQRTCGLSRMIGWLRGSQLIKVILQIGTKPISSSFLAYSVMTLEDLLFRDW